MRILHLTSHLNAGGITTYVVSLAEALAKRGHEVVVASGGGTFEARLEQTGVPRWHAPLATSAEISPHVLWAAAGLARRLRREPVDLIHAHTRVAQVAAAWLSHRLGVPYVTTWHGFYRRRLSRRWWPCTGRLTIAISEPVARHLQEAFGVPATQIRLIPHGIDAAQFAQPPDAAALAAFRTTHRLADGGPVFGTISRLAHDKGIDQVVEAFRDVLARLPQARLLIIGGGPAWPALERQVQECGMAQAVRMVESVPDTRLALWAMDVFVFMPAVREGFGLSLLEAMASRRPVVAVRRGGGASWVLDGNLPVSIVEPDHPAALAAALTSLAQDPQAARALGDQALDVVKARYDVEQMVTQVEGVYEEVAKPRPGH